MVHLPLWLRDEEPVLLSVELCSFLQGTREKKKTFNVKTRTKITCRKITWNMTNRATYTQLPHVRNELYYRDKPYKIHGNQLPHVRTSTCIIEISPGNQLPHV